MALPAESTEAFLKCRVQNDTDPNCYSAKLDAHAKGKLAAMPELSRSARYTNSPEGEKTIPRNKYLEIREEEPDTPEKAK